MLEEVAAKAGVVAAEDEEDLL
jgi:hypothetical protein